MRKYFNDAHLAKKMGRNPWERLVVFCNMMNLRLRRRFADYGRRARTARILNYKVAGFSYSALDFLFREVFLSGEYFFETSSSVPVIVDCGANIGMSVLYFKHLFPDSRIVAFEPNPNAFRLLQRNVEANGLRNVELYDVALSDRDGDISFFISTDPGTLLGSTRSDYGGSVELNGGSVELKARAERLSGYFRRLERIDLVKIDVEGSELKIIDELIEASALRQADQYIIEYHHRINRDASALGAFLRKFEDQGYDYNLKANFRKAGAFQNVIVHLYKEGR